MKKIYFIQVGESGPIKIGSSKDPHVRITQLQVAHHEELNLLAYSERLNESDMHSKFNVHHIKGEWFRPSSEIMNLIEDVKIDNETTELPVHDISSTHINYKQSPKMIKSATKADPKKHVLLTMSGNEAAPLFVHGDMWLINISRTGLPIDGEACAIIYNDHRMLRFWDSSSKTFISTDPSIKPVALGEAEIYGYPVEKVGSNVLGEARPNDSHKP